MPIEMAKTWIDEYVFTTRVVHGVVDGMTHEESLLQLPLEVNCLNWVLGHIVTNRSHALEAVDCDHAWKDEVRHLYHTGTENIRPDGESLQLETLLAYLDTSVNLLRVALENVSEEYLSERFINYRGEKTRLGHLRGFHWHETYHIGQLEIFTALAKSQRK